MQPIIKDLGTTSGLERAGTDYLDREGTDDLDVEGTAIWTKRVQ